MGSFDGSNTTKAIDASVGGLVWVRRRNGSWWPGRIMGLEELSESCLVSPKSGTPVKLLGREDASIDWYNLERSKRVKAFRCGEYDEFIEKAKASVAIASKRAVKYARREDAILQALELESARVGQDQLAFSSKMDTFGGEHDVSTTNSKLKPNSGEVELTNNMSDSEDRFNPMPELSQSGISFEENFSSSMARSGQRRRRTPNDSEDDGTEGVKLMRGLEDLSRGVVSKRKVHAGCLVELVQEDSDVNCNLNTPNCLPNEPPPDDGKVRSSLFKRKRSQVSNVNEISKRKNRHRPLTKVLESTAMLSVPVVCNELPNSCASPLGGLSDGKLSELESNESKKSSSATVNNNSDSTVISCLSPTFSPGRAIGVSERQSSQSSQAEAICVSNELNNESGSTSSAVADPKSHICKTIEKGSSKWQLKGKRNSRHTKKTLTNDSRNFILIDDKHKTFRASTEDLDGFNVGSDQKVSSSIEEPPFSSNKSKSEPEKLIEDGSNELDSIKCISQVQLNTISKKVTKMKQLPDYSWATPRLLPFRQSRFMDHSKYQSYKPQHVPLVSLMSKLNCKAVVGHPLTVEALDDGHCDDLLSRSELDLQKIVESSHLVQSNSWKGKTLGKHRGRAVKLRPSQGKASKAKKSGQLSKKTRKLSSLTVQKQFVDDSRPVVEKFKGSFVACIPLKVVFSRINEAVNGPIAL
ncbi:Tudor/PWWP/MBT superfamily protein, putative isoform 1 [Cucumis melo var. makuwa]|uniref:Tudor/PWWP/MBT superfamily protein, putative isoform 1 n=1 Tax=Cucumis melo var. makuwa TaxID=1194695 RepID=A0A5A7V3M3_CUCMM|nr:Tudor/PWWP/MBT superfamily protein, putative isoform 1 [Cucumis melo var. makuwa]